MAIWGVGVDVVDLARFEKSLERTPGLRSRLFRPEELAAGHTTESLAARFGAKEAFVKALRSPAGLSWQDIEVVQDAAGAPSLELHGAAASRVQELGITAVHLSLSHDTSVATAFVVAES
ncbi:4'-phosphopantetheinyl transferase [Aeromicrobium sp. Root495]|uniref:holo-ACP synthase n=1 Tax=Aeromicrobium sp. Root495 TaxID=1736550 RepID=UPI0006FA56C6|nr:holo-ACP synthase [Aeromicrobium sp. Root495]KQY60778.1 4'-phosphopantetheinyl transferase [Aeromicrobium sp. Root495]